MPAPRDVDGSARPSTTCEQWAPSFLGVPTNQERVATAIRIPAKLHAELQEHAEMRDVSVNFLITRAIEQFIEGLPTRQQVEATLRAS